MEYLLHAGVEVIRSIGEDNIVLADLGDGALQEKKTHVDNALALVAIVLGSTEGTEEHTGANVRLVSSLAVGVLANVDLLAGLGVKVETTEPLAVTVAPHLDLVNQVASGVPVQTGVVLAIAVVGAVTDQAAVLAVGVVELDTTDTLAGSPDFDTSDDNTVAVVCCTEAVAIRATD